MIIASQKRKENIAEYLLYMWQIEDLIRAYHLDIDQIEAQVISRFDQPESVKKQMREWYESLIDMMRREGIVEKGHLQLNKNVLSELSELHQRLLRSGKEPFYTAAFYKALPVIVELRSRSGQSQEGELGTCFSALYGKLLLKLQGKPITPETAGALDQIAHFIALLAKKYNEEREREATTDEIGQ